LRVYADPLRLRQIVNNLIANAVKSTEQGSVRARLRRLDGAGGPTFEFTVQDTGPGLKPEDEGRIFERFEQADGGMTRRYGGTGLGLAISRELAGLMGGRLTCHNGESGGSTFTLTLTLPVVESAVRGPAPARTASAPGRLGPRRVLLADDHPTNRKIVQLILSDPGLDLVAVENGAEAVERFKAERFDAVLMDMQMPVMNGLDATRAIRDYERANGIGETPLIMLTANAMPEHMEAARQAGASRHLAKPITAAGLITAMGELFQAQAAAGPAAAAQARRA
jgi:CheY-like chemotaxis protein